MALAELNGDYTQTHIAERLHVSKSAVTNWKHGTRPDPEHVLQAARVYGADVMELLALAYLTDSEWRTADKMQGWPAHWLPDRDIRGQDTQQRHKRGS
jgi:transcriptional regulator with XRE-family HTH domain